MSGLVSRAMVLERPGVLRSAEYPVPEPGDDEFVLRVERVSICGGDLIEFDGLNRKAHYPLMLGHEVVGRIEAIGQTAAAQRGLRVGSRVIVEPYISCNACDQCGLGAYHFCRAGLVYGVTIPCTRPPHLWGAYSQFLYGAPGAHAHAIDEAVPAEAASLTSVIANGVRWIRTRGRGQVGEAVLVLGLGVQGLATVIAAHEAGLGPIIAAARRHNPRKLELATRYGADVVLDVEAPDIVEKIAEVLGGLALPLAVECTGFERLMDIAIQALGPGGRLVLAGTTGGQRHRVDVDAVVFKEIDFLGGLGQAHDTELAVRIINSRRYSVHEMVTHTFPLAEAPAAIALFKKGRNDVIHVALDPWA
jgi:alcohol dehydrogenase